MNHAFASDKTLKEGCEACLWPHTDGQGLHLILDVVPLESRVTMRVPSENDDVPIGQPISRPSENEVAISGKVALAAC